MALNSPKLQFPSNTEQMGRSVILLVAVLVVLLLSTCAGADDIDAGFGPTWKLMKSDERRYFVAGYMYGWKDAGKVMEIARDYVRENPGNAVTGLEKIRSVYDLSSVRVDEAIRELNAFFADPSNRDATFSQAITRLQRSR
jgi:hypothetical protein